jgi:hypothetical protein
MNPIATFLIFLSIASFLYALVPFVVPSSKKRMESLLKKLSRAGAANHLAFCSQEILDNKVIGIDGIHRKIMILEKVKGGYQSSIISLDDVHDCQLVTNSSSITRGSLKKLVEDNAAITVALQFEFNNHMQPVSIIFTNGIINSKKEFEFLKAKAQYWCAMFSKMLTPQMEARA